jgi:hypothetical protein
MKSLLLADEVGAVELARLIVDSGFKRPAVLDNPHEERRIWVHPDGSQVILNEAVGFRYLQLDGPSQAALTSRLVAASLIRSREEVLAARRWERPELGARLVGFGQLTIVAGLEPDPALRPVLQEAVNGMCLASRDNAKMLSAAGGMLLNVPWPGARLWLERFARLGPKDAWPVLESTFLLLPHAGVDAERPLVLPLFHGVARERVDAALRSIDGLRFHAEYELTDERPFSRVWLTADATSVVRYVEPKELETATLEFSGPEADRLYTRTEALLPLWRRVDLIECMPDKPHELTVAARLAALMGHGRPFDAPLAEIIERTLTCDNSSMRFNACRCFDYVPWAEWIPIIDRRLGEEPDPEVRKELEFSRELLVDRRA